jgi:single-strand DNA-binding protein
VYIEGKLKTRSWDDAEGRKHYMTEVYADKIIKLTRRDQPAQPPQETPPPVTTEQYPETTEEAGPADDLPF